MSLHKRFKKTLDPYQFVDEFSLLEYDISTELENEISDSVTAVDWNSEEYYQISESVDHMTILLELDQIRVYYCPVDQVIKVFDFTDQDGTSMSFSLEFCSGNAAMVEDPVGETVRILKQMIDKVSRHGAGTFDQGKVKDLSGDSIGEYCFDLRRFGD